MCRLYLTVVGWSSRRHRPRMSPSPALDLVVARSRRQALPDSPSLPRDDPGFVAAGHPGRRIVQQRSRSRSGDLVEFDSHVDSSAPAVGDYAISCGIPAESGNDAAAQGWSGRTQARCPKVAPNQSRSRCACRRASCSCWNNASVFSRTRVNGRPCRRVVCRTGRPASSICRWTCWRPGLASGQSWARADSDLRNVSSRTHSPQPQPVHSIDQSSSARAGLSTSRVN